MRTRRVTARKKNKKSDITEILLSVIPVIFALAVIPLIVRLKTVDSVTGSKDTRYDFFAYWKAAALYILCLISLIPAVIMIKKGKLKLDGRIKIFTLFSAAYILLCLISTAFSNNVKIALLGYPCQQEGFLTILAVFLLSFFAAVFINTEKKRDMVIKAVYISSIIIFIIGVFQFIGLDLFKTDFFKSIIVPQKYNSLANGIIYPDDPSQSFRNSIYSTLYNSNVFGTYAAMLLAFSFTDLIYKDRWGKRAIPLTVMFLSMFTLIGCYSRGAYLGAAFAVFAVIVLSIKRIRSNFKETVICILILVLSAIPAALWGGGKVLDRLATVDVSYQDTVTGVQSRINDFNVTQNVLKIYFNKNVLVIEKKGDNLEFKDGNGKVLMLDYSAKDEGYVINSDGYKDFLVFANKEKLYIKKQNSLMNFIIKDNSFVLADFSGNPAKIDTPETMIFGGKERFASGRGYIWSRALPLIKKTVFKGFGPDNFYFAFPQNDYMGKLKFMYNAYIPIDMAHNMFLQSAVETGVLSMLILIALLIWLVFVNIKSAFSGDSVSGSTSVALVAVIAAYAICGIFTDANICTMIVFWPLAGLLLNYNSNK